MIRFFSILVLLFVLVSSPVMADDGYKSLVIKSGKQKHVFKIEVADNHITRERGLMFRKSLERDRGMLFVFKIYKHQNIWMKNTLIPLDILFIDEDGQIVKIHERAKPLDLTIISSGQPVVAALEIAGGQAETRGLAVGDKVIYPVFRK